MFHLHAASASGWPPADLLHLARPEPAPPASPDDADLASPRPAPPAGHLFGGTIARQRGVRAARRGAFTTGATVVELLVAAAVVTVPLATPPPQGPLVAVKLVRSAAPPPVPPPPPPAAAPARPRPVTARAPAPRPAMGALVQPRELPAELAPATPAPEPEEGDLGGDPDGVVGGGGWAPAPAVAAPAVPPPPPRPAAPVRFDDRMTPPALLHAPPLEYTQQALEREVQGEVQVACVVDLEGRVAKCRVLRGLPFLDGAVVENLQARRYRPATLGGEPLTVEYVFTVRFRLPD